MGLSNSLPSPTAFSGQIDLFALRRAREIAAALRESVLVYMRYDISADALTPLVSTQPDGQYLTYWEKPNEHLTMASRGAVLAIDFESEGEKASAIGKMEQVLKRSIDCTPLPQKENRPKVLGGFAFDAHSNGASGRLQPWGQFPRGLLVLPEALAVKRQAETMLIVSQLVEADTDIDSTAKKIDSIAEMCLEYLDNRMPSGTQPTCTEMIDIPERGDYLEKIERAKSTLGDSLSKVVLSRTLRLEFDSALRSDQIIERLRYRYPDCFTFMIQVPDAGYFIGATPERLLRIDDDIVHTEALAGTIARGETDAEDRQRGEFLLANHKDLSEHNYVVDYFRRRLEPISDDLKIPDDPMLFVSNDLLHLRSPISCRLRISISGADLVSSLHPTPAVAGTPTERAIEVIRELEGFDRGWYAGVLGWMDGNGQADFIVGLRSAFINGNTAHLFAGGGIVEESVAETEWEETRWKFLAMRYALGIPEVELTEAAD